VIPHLLDVQALSPFAERTIDLPLGDELYEAADRVDRGRVPRDDQPAREEPEPVFVDRTDFPVAHAEDRDDDHVGRVEERPARRDVAPHADRAGRHEESQPLEHVP